MKSYTPLAFCVVFCTAALVSCETNRVNERPLGSVSRPIFPTGDSMSPLSSNGSSLLNDIQSQGSGGSGSISDPAQESNTGTISRLLDGIGAGTPNSVGNNNSLTSPSHITPPQSVAPPVQVNTDIPTAWAVPGDPTVVRSPYDSTKKVRIVDRRTGVPYPSGTILRDTNFPNEMRKFRVP